MEAIGYVENCRPEGPHSNCRHCLFIFCDTCLRRNQESTTAPKKKGFSTLPGWSAGYRYNFDADDNSATRLRLFLKRKSLAGSIVKLAWERQTGTIPNFFKTGTIDGNSLNKFGTFYIEQEYKF